MLRFEEKVNMTEAFVFRLNKRFLCWWLTRKTAVTNPRGVTAMKDKYAILQVVCIFRQIPKQCGLQIWFMQMKLTNWEISNIYFENRAAQDVLQ